MSYIPKRKKNPNRWSKGIRNWEEIGDVKLNPENKKRSCLTAQATTTLKNAVILERLEAMTLDIPTEYYQAMAGCAKAWVSFKQVETLLPELGLDNESFVKNAVQDANALSF